MTGHLVLVWIPEKQTQRDTNLSASSLLESSKNTSREIVK